jgi:hypothetical protein
VSSIKIFRLRCMCVYIYLPCLRSCYTPAYLILLHLTALITFREAPHCAVFSSLPPLSLPQVQISGCTNIYLKTLLRLCLESHKLIFLHHSPVYSYCHYACSDDATQRATSVNKHRTRRTPRTVCPTNRPGPATTSWQEKHFTA